MNTVRMFAFAVAVLITAFLLRVMVNATAVEQPLHGEAAAAVVRQQSTGN